MLDESCSQDRSGPVDKRRARSTRREQSQQRWEKCVSNPAVRRGNSNDRRFIKIVPESGLNDKLGFENVFDTPSSERSESADRRRDRSRSTGREPSQERGKRRDKSYCSATRRCNSSDRRNVNVKRVKTLHRSRDGIPRYTRQELVAARTMEEEWNLAMGGFGHNGEERKPLDLGGPVARPMSRKKMRKLMRHRRVSLPNEDEESDGDGQSISPRCDHNIQSVDLDQPAPVHDNNNNSDGHWASKQNPNRKESRLPLMKRIWSSMCCSSDQGQGSTVDPFIGCRKLFRLKSKAKKLISGDNTSLKHDEVPSWKLLRKYQSARNEMVDNLSSLDYNGLVIEYQNLLKTDSMNEEVTHTMENVHEIVQTDAEYESYCQRFQADQEALMRRYARARAERERLRLRADISNAVISRGVYQRQIDEISEKITELTIILNGVHGVKGKKRENANKNSNAKSSEKRFDGSEPLPAGIKETEEVPFPNLSVLLKDIEQNAMEERGEMFEKRAEIAERLRLAEENGGVLPPREVKLKRGFEKREKRPEYSVQAERTNVEGQTPALITESVSQQKESERQAGCGQKRAVAFVIDVEDDNHKEKVKKLPPKQLAQRLRVKEENSVQKVQRAVAFVVDIGDGDTEFDARRTKKMASLTSKKMSNQVCPDSNSFEGSIGNERQVRFVPGTKQENKTLANHAARRSPPTNSTRGNIRSSLNRNQKIANQKLQPSKWRTNRTHELATKQRVARAKLFSNSNASSNRTPSKYSSIKSSISTFRNNKNDTGKSKCYTTRKASNVETKPGIVKQTIHPIANYATVKSAISTFRNKNKDTNKSKCYTAWKARNVEASKTENKLEIIQKKQPIAKYTAIKSVISTFRKETDKSKESTNKTETEKQLFTENKQNTCDKTHAKYAHVQEFARVSRLRKETIVFKYRSHPMHATWKTRIPKPCATVIGAARRFADRFIASLNVPGRVALRKDYWREKFVDKPWKYNVVCDMPKSYQKPRARKASKIPLISSSMVNTNKYRLKSEVCKPDVPKPNAPVAYKRESNATSKAATSWHTKNPLMIKRTDSIRDQIGDNLHHEGEITPRCFSPYSPLPPITPRMEVKPGLVANTPTKEKEQKKGLKNGSKGGELVTPKVNVKSPFDGTSPPPQIKTSRSASSHSATRRSSINRFATIRSATSRKSTAHVTPRGNIKYPLDAIKPLPPIKDGRKTGVHDVITDRSAPVCNKFTHFIKPKAVKQHAVRAAVGNPPQSCLKSKHPPKELPPLCHSPKMTKPNDDKSTMRKSHELNRKPNQLPPLRHSTVPSDKPSVKPAVKEASKSKRKPNQLTPLPHSPVYKDKPAVEPAVNEASKSKRKPSQLTPLPHSPAMDPDGSPLPVGQYTYNFDVPNDMVGFKSKFQILRTPEPNYGR